MISFFSHPKAKSFFAAFLVLSALTVLFRVYPLLAPALQQSFIVQNAASKMVTRAITQQLKATLDQQLPQMSDREKWDMAEAQAQKIIRDESGKFEGAVKNAAAQMVRTPPVSRTGKHYLLEADPYYYYDLTKEVARTGRIGTQIKNGRYLNPLMQAPHGYWTDFVIHPYLGYFWYRLVSFFRPGIDMMEALSSFPVLLCVFVAALFLLLAFVMEKSAFAAFCGGMVLLLSPIFIQRSAFGWYDTDPYNYLFPLGILLTVFLAVKKDSHVIPCAVAAGFLTGFYALFWTGWAFIPVVIPGCLLGTWLVMRFFPRFKQAPELNRMRRYFLWYLLLSVVSIVVFLTPQGTLNSLAFRWDVLRKFALSGFDLWPNMFLTVGEAQGIGFKKLVFLSGNYVSFAIAAAGFVLVSFRAWKERNAQAFLQWLILAGFTVPLLMMALKTERFSVLFVMPLAIFVMIGIQELQRWLEKKSTGFIKEKHSRFRTVICAGILSAVFLPLLLIMAHIVSLGVKPIMNDVWYEHLTEVGEKTPENAIINSWWPPGYFVTAIAHRRVTIDGGTQHLRQPYWMAKVLASQDERESAGILRMLNTSANDAMVYLESLGYETPEAVDLILQSVPLSREEARAKLPVNMKSEAQEYFLNLTHGSGDLPPTYVFVYNDLIEQNLAITVAANWNFHKAREMRKAEAVQSGIGKLFNREKTTGYMGKVFSLIGGVLKYTPEAPLQRREGNLLLFGNGLAVDLATKDAQMIIQGMQGRPISLFYMEGDRLVEKEFPDRKIDVSALLIENEGTYSTVVADAKLIRSLMFRLYYLKGKGLRFFKPFLDKKDAGLATTVATYELRREAFAVSASGTPSQPSQA